VSAQIEADAIGLDGDGLVLAGVSGTDPVTLRRIGSGRG